MPVSPLCVWYYTGAAVCGKEDDINARDQGRFLLVSAADCCADMFCRRHALAMRTIAPMPVLMMCALFWPSNAIPCTTTLTQRTQGHGAYPCDAWRGSRNHVDESVGCTTGVVKHNCKKFLFIS